MSRDSFFIGYTGKMPKGDKRIISIALFVFLILMIISCSVFILHQASFSSGKFKYGKLTEFEGFLFSDPFPSLILRDSIGRYTMQAALLVGPMKSGADAILEDWNGSGMVNGEGRSVKIRGTLIRENENIVIELTDGVESLLTAQTQGMIQPPIHLDRESAVMTGEITDPKCLFGAMKPGFGKTHRSCAALCIASGIPAVFETPEGYPARYFLIDWSEMKDSKIPPSWLRHVGEQVSVTGDTYRWMNWRIIKPSTDYVPMRLYSEVDLKTMNLCTKN